MFFQFMYIQIHSSKIQFTTNFTFKRFICIVGYTTMSPFFMGLLNYQTRLNAAEHNEQGNGLSSLCITI